jgi:hypothetical protein
MSRDGNSPAGMPEVPGGASGISVNVANATNARLTPGAILVFRSAGDEMEIDAVDIGLRPGYCRWRQGDLQSDGGWRARSRGKRSQIPRVPGFGTAWDGLGTGPQARIPNVYAAFDGWTYPGG